jgi:ATP-dependent Zn protease
LIHSFAIEPCLHLDQLRKNKKNDVQAIVAVHESGHAIVASLLLKTVPEVIFSNTADIDSSGYVYTKFKWEYISKKEIKKRLAFYLAGYCAEKVIFGEENVTTGSEKDIEKATESSPAC